MGFTLQETNPHPTVKTGSSENHGLKNALGWDMLVPKRRVLGLRYVVYLLVLCFWQRLRRVFFRPLIVFVDKLCIAQHDEELKAMSSETVKKPWRLLWLHRRVLLPNCVQVCHSKRHCKGPYGPTRNSWIIGKMLVPFRRGYTQ